MRELKLIKKVRANNNELWMTILEIALTNAPKKTKKVLAKIRKNDLEVSRLTGWIAYADSRKKNRK